MYAVLQLLRCCYSLRRARTTQHEEDNVQQVDLPTLNTADDSSLSKPDVLSTDGVANKAVDLTGNSSPDHTLSFPMD